MKVARQLSLRTHRHTSDSTHVCKNSPGHVNHVVYLHYCEVGRLEAMARARLPFSAVLKQGYTVVAADAYVQYKIPALYRTILCSCAAPPWSGSRRSPG